MTTSPRTPWACLDCPETGDTQAAAERHTKLGHATTTAATADGAARIAARVSLGGRGCGRDVDGPHGYQSGQHLPAHDAVIPGDNVTEMSASAGTIVRKDTTNASAPEQRRWNAAQGPRRTKDTTDV